MFFEILIAIFLGIFFGTLTGLIPGIHNNLVAGIFFGLIGYFSKISVEIISIFILSLGLTHTFISFIPSLLLGVASSDTALSILPGQKLLMQGDAKLAIFLSGIGSLLAVFSSIPLVFLFFQSLENIYNFTKDYIAYGLLIVVLILILQENTSNKKFWAFLIVLFSSTLGILTLNSYILVEPLLVLFSGLFGGSQIISSFVLKISKIPPQKKYIKYPKVKEFFLPTIIGTFCASVCAIFPGIGNSQAGALSSIFTKKISFEGFIVILSVINTVNFMLSFVTLYILDRARNGSLIIISNILVDISKQDILLFFTCMVLVGILVFPLTIFLGSKIINFIEKINFFYLNLSILIFLSLLIFFISSYIGILVFVCASFLGAFCILLGIRRVHLMAVLIIPIILNFLF